MEVAIRAIWANGILPDDAGQISTHQIGTRQIGAMEVGTSQDSPTQIGASQIGIGECEALRAELKIENIE